MANLPYDNPNMLAYIDLPVSAFVGDTRDFVIRKEGDSMPIDIKMILPPGDILEDMMEMEQVSPEKLSEITSIHLTCVEGILAAEHAITPATAQKLESHFYGAASWWLNPKTGKPFLRSCIMVA